MYYTSSTIEKRISSVRKAIQCLETIGNEVNLSIIHFLKSHSEVSFSRLRAEIGISSIQLEKYLQFLSKNDILEIKGSSSEKRYTLNQYKLLKIQLLTKALIRQPIEV